MTLTKAELEKSNEDYRLKLEALSAELEAALSSDVVSLPELPDPEAFVNRCLTPFPDDVIGKLPRLTCKECMEKRCKRHSPARCDVCDKWISTQHIHLDYVGHAGVTDRLLSLDPLWNWEPVAFDDRGLPAIIKGSNSSVMWIRLTVCGVTRLGVGSASNGTGDVVKELIGDALRNAAMRFGIALHLWAKDGLAGNFDADSSGDESVLDEPVRAITAEQLADIRAQTNAIENDDNRNGCKIGFKEAFGLPKELPANRFDEALEFIAAWAVRPDRNRQADRPSKVKPGSEEPFEPQKPAERSKTISDDELEDLQETVVGDTLMRLFGQNAIQMRKELMEAGCWPIEQIGADKIDDAIAVAERFQS